MNVIQTWRIVLAGERERKFQGIMGWWGNKDLQVQRGLGVGVEVQIVGKIGFGRGGLSWVQVVIQKVPRPEI